MTPRTNWQPRTLSIGKLFLLQKKHLQAAYMLRWSEVLASTLPEDSLKPSRDQAWFELSRLLPRAQLENLRQRSGNFSEKELASLTLATVPSRGVRLSAQRRRCPPTEIMKAAAARFSAGVVPRSPAEGKSITLPAQPDQIVATDGGGCAMSFRSPRRLESSNLARADFDGFIESKEPRPLVASGGQLLIDLVKARLFRAVHDLRTLKMIASKDSPVQGKIVFVGMAFNPARAFALIQDHIQLIPYSLTLPRLSPTKLELPKNGGTLRATTFLSGTLTENGVIEGTMDETGKLAAVTDPIGPNHTGALTCYATGADGHLELTYNRTAISFPAVVSNSKVVIGNHTFFDGAAQPPSQEHIAKALARWSIPYAATAIIGYRGFLELAEQWGIGQFPGCVRSRPLPRGHAPFQRSRRPLPRRNRGRRPIDRLLASAPSDRFVHLPSKGNHSPSFPLACAWTPPDLGAHNLESVLRESSNSPRAQK